MASGQCPPTHSVLAAERAFCSLFRLIGHQPYIVDDLIEPGIGARSPVRMARLDHSESQQAGHNVEGRPPIDGRWDPAEPIGDAPADREESLALRRQEGINAAHLKGPGQRCCNAAAMLDLPEQLEPFRTMQVAVIPQGCLSMETRAEPHRGQLANGSRAHCRRYARLSAR
jgi:hypothetical protein